MSKEIELGWYELDRSINYFIAGEDLESIHIEYLEVVENNGDEFIVREYDSTLKPRETVVVEAKTLRDILKFSPKIASPK